MQLIWDANRTPRLDRHNNACFCIQNWNNICRLITQIQSIARTLGLAQSEKCLPKRRMKRKDATRNYLRLSIIQTTSNTQAVGAKRHQHDRHEGEDYWAPHTIWKYGANTVLLRQHKYIAIRDVKSIHAKIWWRRIRPMVDLPIVYLRSVQKTQAILLIGMQWAPNGQCRWRTRALGESSLLPCAANKLNFDMAPNRVRRLNDKNLHNLLST